MLRGRLGSFAECERIGFSVELHVRCFRHRGQAIPMRQSFLVFVTAIGRARIRLRQGFRPAPTWPPAGRGYDERAILERHIGLRANPTALEHFRWDHQSQSFGGSLQFRSHAATLPRWNPGDKWYSETMFSDPICLRVKP